MHYNSLNVSLSDVTARLFIIVLHYCCLVYYWSSL